MSCLSKVKSVFKLCKQKYNRESEVMGSGSTRPNNADEKMMAAIERGEQSEFKDSKPPIKTDKTLIKAKKVLAKNAMGKNRKIKSVEIGC